MSIILPEDLDVVEQYSGKTSNYSNVLCAFVEAVSLKFCRLVENMVNSKRVNLDYTVQVMTTLSQKTNREFTGMK